MIKSKSKSNLQPECLCQKKLMFHSIYANPVFWVPVSWGKVFMVLRPLPNC